MLDDASEHGSSVLAIFFLLRSDPVVPSANEAAISYLAGVYILFYFKFSPREVEKINTASKKFLENSGR